MGGWQIPLMGQRAPQMNPYQAAAQGQQDALNAQSMQQQQQVRDQEMQQRAIQMQGQQEQVAQQQMQTQQMQRQQSAQKAYADALPKYISQGPSGMPVVDFRGMAVDLATQGHGEAAQAALTQGWTDLESRMKTGQNQLKLGGEKAGRLGAIAGSITDENTKAIGINQAVQEGLIDPQSATGLIATPFDKLQPQLGQWKAQALNVQQQHEQALKDAEIALRTNEFNHRVATDAPKTTEGWANVAFQQIGAARDQKSLDFLRTNLQAQGVPKEVLNQIPSVWGDDTADTIRNLGMTAEQRTRAEETEAAHEELHADRQQANAIRQQGVDLRTGGGARETAQQYKDRISTLADQAMTESDEGGGGSVADALANVRNPGFYQNHPIGQARGQVINELMRRQKADLDLQRSQSQVTKGQGGLAFVPDPDHPGKLKLSISGTASAIPATNKAQPPQSAATQQSTQKPSFPDGAGKKLDQATAQSFYDASGGDPVKARALAKQYHWTF